VLVRFWGYTLCSLFNSWLRYMCEAAVKCTVKNKISSCGVVWVWHLVNFSFMWSNCQHCSKHGTVYLECKLTRKALQNFLLSVSISNFILRITDLKVPHTKMLHAELSANFLCGSSVFHFLLLSTNQNSCLEYSTEPTQWIPAMVRKVVDTKHFHSIGYLLSSRLHTSSQDCQCP